LSTEQEHSRLLADLDRYRQAALRKIWVPPPPAPLQVTLASYESPADVPFEPMVAFVDGVRRATGIELRLSGGGHGCLNFAFNADAEPESEDAADIVTRAPDTQRALNEARMHLVRVKSPRADVTLRPYNDIDLAIITNRNRMDTPTNDDMRGLFGTERGAPSYGFAKVSISDLSKRQPRESLGKRIWRKAKGIVKSDKDHEVVRREMKLYKPSEFADVVKQTIGKGLVTAIHGYANDFDDAFDGWTLALHRARLRDLDLLPLIFSWPAGDSAVRYARDTNWAAKSELDLLKTLDFLSETCGSKPPSVIAHSHGNMLLVRSLTTAVTGRAEKRRWLDRLVLVEPDVDQEFLEEEERFKTLANAANHIALYHSKNDVALKFASMIFDSVRAGQEGLKVADDTQGQLEIIDATRVAAGVTRHAPHIDSPDVISDLYYLFQGQKAEQRYGLRPLSGSRWELVNPLGR
jgi:esterase/lipase superfamily enzyme